MITEDKIEEIKDKIVKTVSPEKIILFGSYATGEATEESDIDLVVIWDSDLNPHKRNLFLSRLFPKRDFSLDIFAFTKEEANKLKDIAGTILYEAFHHGKVIYAR
ncbi:MAG: nucleotidyltransferase domain-containing protein [Nitrospiraceae bacterium]|nr:nucleotidyltransferase domain-containing protein [Nitrospirota bacterium]MDA8340050.1 nucleotidyltransferase domain-containing protein [Nitrospiraceae bacterium]